MQEDSRASSQQHGCQDESTPLLARNHSLPDRLDLDARFKRWTEAVANKFKRNPNSNRSNQPTILISVFQKSRAAAAAAADHPTSTPPSPSPSPDFTHADLDSQLELVRHAISQGVYPKMITTGSSGSYFVKARDPLTHQLTTVAVFKPKDEEPYGNLNPKRQFLRRYAWWAMGRPCLIPNFSYLSEVGASYLDRRLDLNMVPRTELVSLSSPSFHYAYSDRIAYEHAKQPLPEKEGSYQIFLQGYVNASDFLRSNPWPSRPRSLMLQDFDAEQRAHRLSRKRERARLRKCGIAIKRFLLCRHGVTDLVAVDAADLEPGPETPESRRGVAASEDPLSNFSWTPALMSSFRLELERLVVLDYLMRNTDRGLDNFMVKPIDPTHVKLGAIDNSLSFPTKHPNAIRQYPFGWLFLPTDLIGLPFSDSTRQHFLPILSDPDWWIETVNGLRELFQRDPYFDPKRFEQQMSVMRGQGWNLVQCLESPTEGPLELCAREKQLVKQEVVTVHEAEVEKAEGSKVYLDKANAPAPVPAATHRRRLAERPTSRPIRMTKGTAATSMPSELGDLAVGAHPRSLPESSGIMETSIADGSPRGHHHQRFLSLEGASEARLSAYRGALGIEVVEKLDEEARKARRPRTQRSLRGLGPGPHRITRSHSGDAHPREGQGTDMVSSIISDPGRSLMWRPLGGDRLQEEEVAEIPSDEEEDGDDDDDKGDDPTHAKAGSASTSRDGSLSPTRPEAPRRRSEAAAPVSHGAGAAPPSIHAILSSTQNAAAVGSDAPPGEESAGGAKRAGRRRDGSVGAWSIASSLGLGPERAESGREARQKGKKVKVILEKLEADTRQAWLKWI